MTVTMRRLSAGELAARELARTSREPRVLVRLALADLGTYKNAVLSLRECAPDADAARMVIDAYDRRETMVWLAACLLAHVRHRDGYAKLAEILAGGDGNAVGYAAEGLVAIAGADAEPDLMRAIDTLENERARGEVAGVLAGLGTPSAFAFLLAAPARGRLEGRTLGRALTRVHVEPSVMVAALGSPDRETRRWPTVTIAKRLVWRDREPYARELALCAASFELRAALASALEEPSLAWHTHASAIRAWLEGR